MSIGAIVGIVVGLVAGLALLLAIIGADMNFDARHCIWYHALPLMPLAAAHKRFVLLHAMTADNSASSLQC